HYLVPLLPGGAELGLERSPRGLLVRQGRQQARRGHQRRPRPGLPPVERARYLLGADIQLRSECDRGLFVILHQVGAASRDDGIGARYPVVEVFIESAVDHVESIQPLAALGVVAHASGNRVKRARPALHVIEEQLDNRLEEITLFVAVLFFPPLPPLPRPLVAGPDDSCPTGSADFWLLPMAPGSTTFFPSPLAKIQGVDLLLLREVMCPDRPHDRER